MQKKFVAAVAAASTLAGAAGGAALLGPGPAGAQDSSDSATEAPTDVAEQTEAEAVRPDGGERLSEVLQPLVDDGTLTDAQRQAVVEQIQASRPERGHLGRHDGDGPNRGRFGQRGGPGLSSAVLDILGIDSAALRDAIAAGSTIADIAAEQGVALDDVIGAMIDETKARVDEAVTAGRVDADRAEEMLAKAAERADAFVNGELPPGRGHRVGGLDAEATDAGD